MMCPGCGDNEPDPPNGVKIYYDVRVVVLENGTNTRVANAYIIVDSDSGKTCYTSEPGGATGGECFFDLTYGEHEFVVSKSGYETATYTQLVTEMTPSIYIPLWQR
jgi:hypothetical protein